MDPWNVGGNSQVDDRFVLLDRLMTKEIALFLDTCLLEKYINLNLTPRGLRIDKLPATDFSEEEHDLLDEWKQASLECTNKWLRILIKRNQRAHDKLKSEILHLQDKVVEESCFRMQFSNINEKISKLETDILHRKRNKLLRDMKDYETGILFSWQREVTRSRSKVRRSSLKRRSVSASSGE